MVYYSIGFTTLVGHSSIKTYYLFKITYRRFQKKKSEFRRVTKDERLNLLGRTRLLTQNTIGLCIDDAKVPGDLSLLQCLRWLKNDTTLDMFLSQKIDTFR